MSISAISFSDCTIIYSAPSAPKESSSIMLFEQNSCNNINYEPKFDKEGYPIPDEDKLEFHKGNKLFFTKDQYVYTCNGRESIGDIKQKFHIKDKGIQICQPYIRDDEWVPERGKKICFYKEYIDVTKKK